MSTQIIARLPYIEGPELNGVLNLKAFGVHLIREPADAIWLDTIESTT